jgi:hypothetical protein
LVIQLCVFRVPMEIDDFRRRRSSREPEGYGADYLFRFQDPRVLLNQVLR